NELILEGVVIEWDTRFRQALRSPVHTNDIEIRGSGNRIRGLEIRCLGDGTSPGGALVSIQGKDNLLEDCRFHVRGSSPYGYGDVFGKGSPTIISHRKQNGVQVAGNGTVLRRCHLKMESFGHGIYIQKNAQDILIEDCLVEGEVRKTEEMLAETSGPAFDKGFRTTFRNHEGKETLLRGYMKSLAEDGFRTYDDNRNVVIRNCVARNMRGGFELRTKSGAVAENCRAEGCERGFWVGDHSVVKGCFADVIYGPALYVEGRGVRADIEVDLTESDRIVHQLASLHGEGHEVVIRGGEGEATRDLPIRIGFSTPPAGENMAPAVERPARRMKLINETPMPVLVGAQSQGVVVKSRGPVVDRGKETVKEEMGE
ncbi:MAG: right-handed parallel beta-helix repeat-containing protein, partial [Akkermansiaceae bacterium]|nr:right-handed parallel beta-helix repeat-containing protein [Akkermansiaceae bacterium]